MQTDTHTIHPKDLFRSLPEADPSPSRDAVFCEVQDSGSGVHASDLQRIFEPFVQGDPSLTRAHGGVGLGLPVCRRLAHLLDGDLCVVSTPGRGSIFTLRLPHAKPASPSFGSGATTPSA